MDKIRKILEIVFDGRTISSIDNQDVFKKVLEKMRENQIDVLYLYVMGYSVHEISDMLGKKEGVIYFHLKNLKKYKIYLKK